MWRYATILALCGVLAGCGGRGVVSSGTNSTPEPPSTPVTTSSNNPTNTGTSSAAPTPVNVTAGDNISAVNITVAAASAQTPNSEDLGVNSTSGLGMAANTGDAIPRGSTMRVLLFGPGLNSSMQVSIAGPRDITVSNLQSIQATDNTPGIAFTASVSPNAALGARTVYLKNPNGDMTSFTGGLEVVP